MGRPAGDEGAGGGRRWRPGADGDGGRGRTAMEAGGGRRWGPGADAGADAGAEVRACPGVFGTKEDVCDLSIPTGGSQGVSGGTRRRPPSDRDPPDPASDGGPPRSGRGVRVRGAAAHAATAPRGGRPDSRPRKRHTRSSGAVRHPRGWRRGRTPLPGLGKRHTRRDSVCDCDDDAPHRRQRHSRLQARTECDVIRAPAPGASGRRPAPAPGAPAKADHPHPDDAPARRTRPSQTSVANPRRRAHAREVRNSLHSDFSVSPATAAHDFAALSGPGRASSPPARTSAQLGPAFSLTGV